MFKRLLSLFVGIFITIVAGACSTYPIYSMFIREKFKYSLREINLYGSFINVGLWVAFTVGIIYDDYGPKISNVCSLFILFISYLFLYLIVKSNLSSLNIFWLLILGLLIGQGSALAYTNALSTSIKNFHKILSSKIVGIIVSNMAISASIFSSYKEFFSNLSMVKFVLNLFLFVVLILFLSIFLFDKYEMNKMDDFNIKLFKITKQTYLIKIFTIINTVTISLFVIFVTINTFFDIQLPSFIVFPFCHMFFILILILEKTKKFNWQIFNMLKKRHSNINNFNLNSKKIVVVKNDDNEDHTKSNITTESKYFMTDEINMGGGNKKKKLRI